MYKWRVRLVVTKATQRFASAAVENLLACGVEEIEIYSPRGISLNLNEELIPAAATQSLGLKDGFGRIEDEMSKRAERLLGYQDEPNFDPSNLDEDDNENVSVFDRVILRTKLPRQDTLMRGVSKPPHVIESLTYALALESVGASVISTTDFMLVVGAELAIWHGLPNFLEQTIKKQQVCLYFPYTPRLFFSAHEYSAPRSGEGLIGWSEFLMSEPVTGCRCIAGSAHTFMILSSLIRESRLASEADWDDHFWDYRFYLAVASSGIKCYSAVRSMAFHRKDVADKEWALPQTAKLGDVSMYEPYHSSGI